MKRILAVFLTLAMALNIAPMAAFAAADSDAASIVAVEETDETSSPQLDEETARAIASDPFLQAAYAQTEQEQTGQSEVDTSKVSMTATDSFGQLLANGVNEQNGTSSDNTSRITKVQLNGHTANVEFVTDEAADLVVAVYADSAAEEMVASGTEKVSGDGGNGSSKVAITGDIPEYYTVKAYLLRQSDHSPLSEVYTDTSNTQAIVEIKNAKISDFPEDRVVNLDENDNTNFVVVNEAVTLLTYEDNTAGTNQFVSEDDAGLVYVIENASAEIKNLQHGDILTYEYTPGEMLIVRVKDVAVSGDTVTIYGDDTLELEDVFDVMKIENEADTQDFTYTPAEGFTDRGEGTIDASRLEGGSNFEFEDSNATNSDDDKELYLPKVSKKMEFFKEVDSKDNASDPGHTKDDPTVTVKATVSGTLNLSTQGVFHYYISQKCQSVEFGITTLADLDLGISGEAELSAPIGYLDFSPVTGLFVGMEPALVVRAKVQIDVEVLISSYVGCRYNSKADLEEDSSSGTATADPRVVSTTTEPAIKIVGKAEGSLFVGIDLQPRVSVLGKWILSIEMSCEFGGQITLKMNAETIDQQAHSRHTCGICYSGKVDFHASGDITFTFLKGKIKVGAIPLIDVEVPLGEFYWSPSRGEFGKGECPHTGYRVQMWLTTTDTLTNEDVDGVIVYNRYSNGQTAELGTYERSLLDGAKVGYIYLEPGLYQLQVTVKGATYTSDKFAIEDEARDFMYMYQDYQGSTGGNPGTTEPDNPDQQQKGYTLKNGILTINNAEVLAGYDKAVNLPPWYDSREDINRIVVRSGITQVGAYSFANCTNVTMVTFGDKVVKIDEAAFLNCIALTDVYYAGSVEDWTAVAIAAQNEALQKAKIHCSDGVLAESGTCGENVTWTLTTDGLLTISGQGAMGTPDKNWANRSVAVKKVVVKPGVTSVVSNAFKSCASLKEVVLPEGMETIGVQAFYNCYALESVSIPEGVREIGARCFCNCYKLTEAVLPQTVSAIGSAVFYHCSALKKVELPVQITTMDTASMFSGCPQLTEVQLPDGVTKIGAYAFSGCTSLTTVKVPESVTSIGESAFNQCSNLENLNLPAGITSMECKYTFNGCKKLTAKIVVPDGTTKIGDSTFQDCAALPEIVLPDTVTEIGKNAFDGCKNWSNATIPSKVTSIGEYAYRNCLQLKHAEIPADVIQIEKGTFYYCSALQSVTIPVGVKQIGMDAFGWCTALETVNLPDSVATIGSAAFRNCTSLNSINVPNGIQNIENKTFEDCNSLKKIALPESVRRIGEDAFAKCYKLEQVTMPTQLTELGEYAFFDCYNLQNITIPNGITKIGRYTFTHCEKLTSAVIPEGVTTVGKCAFCYCRKLYSLQIPASITELSDDALYYTENLMEVIYTGTKAQWAAVKIGQHNGFDWDQGNAPLHFNFHCTDGDILPTSTASENSITTGTAVTSDSKFQATFADAKAGKEYVVLVSRSGSDPLNADNLIYINQITADADGELTVPFITAADAAEMTYVVACAQDDAPVDPGQPDKPNQPDQPGGDKPGGDQPSSGGDGGGAAIILIGGVAAVAAVAGVVLMMPVKVEGTVKLADQPVANATVQVLKNGNVTAQTTTDANGHFTVKVKRGGYTMRVQWTDASGQPVTRTVDFKAPDANLNVAA